MTHEDPTFDVRVWGIRTYRGARGTTFTVRWRVNGAQHQQTFQSRRMADGARAEILAATRSGKPFDPRTGLPVVRVERPEVIRTFFDLCTVYASVKWPDISPQHRKSINETLTRATQAALPTDRGPAAEVLRRALYRHAFNPTAHPATDGTPEALALAWAARSSPSLTTVSEIATIRSIVSLLGTNLDGTRAAASTASRRRAVLHGCLQHAVLEGWLAENPLVRVPRTRKSRHAAVDRRVVVNPDQARSILQAARERAPELEAFFACLYYAGLRPAEARNLRLANCDLPRAGWGRLTLTGSFQSVGPAFTDGGVAGEERELKHRSPAETRRVPAHPDLVAVLQRHIAGYSRSSDGRLFVNRKGTAGVPLPPPHETPVSMSTVYRAWHLARNQALGTEAGLLARRPYDLRHAAVSTWLNAGVPAAQVAEWAGHTVAVLLTVYAKCIDGEEDAALRRIELATQG